MARPDEEVEARLQEYADLIAITGGEAFKARAYEKAARAIGGHPADVSHMDVTGLREIPGVGKSIAEKVIEYRTGNVTAVEERRARVPAGVRELISIPTLGPTAPCRAKSSRRCRRRSLIAASGSWTSREVSR